MTHIIDETGSPIAFTRLGQKIIDLGKKEIFERGLSTVEDTEVNKLHIYWLYEHLVQESFIFIGALKSHITTELDKFCADRMDSSHMNTNASKDILTVPEALSKALNQYIHQQLTYFINRVDTPVTLNLCKASKPNNFSLLAKTYASVLNHNNNPLLLITAISLMVMIIGLLNEDRKLAGCGLVGMLSIPLLSNMSRRHIFFHPSSYPTEFAPTRKMSISSQLSASIPPYTSVSDDSGRYEVEELESDDTIEPTASTKRK